MKTKIITSIAIMLGTCTFAQQNMLNLINQNVTSNGKAYENLKFASETIGHRATGTKNGKLAEDLAANLLKSYGFNVKFQEFTFNGWDRNSLKLSIDGKEISSVALAHSPAKAKLSGELIDLGNGLEEDYIKVKEQVKGKIVFAALGLLDGTSKENKNLHRSEKTALAEKYGAKGIILFNKAKGEILLTGTASVTGDIIKIPAINISYEDGVEIKNKLASNSISSVIDMKNKVGKMKGRNIIARLKGSELPDEKIILGGHLDSWDLATGAIDNGVGSFSVIDVARTFKELKIKNKRTIEFVLFMGEEVGLLGSKHYVNEAIKDGTFSTIKAMSNMDMTYDPKAYYSSMQENLNTLTDLSNDIKSTISDFELKPFTSLDLHSDHQPFMLQGIPIIGFSKNKFLKGALDCYHANCDEIRFVEKDGLINNVITSTYLIYSLSNLDKFPSTRWNEDKIKEELIKAKLEPALRISGDWRWK